MKICSKCNITKELSSFYKSKKEKDGYQYYCKDCCYESNKGNKTEKFEEQHLEYRNKNRKKLCNKSKEYYQNNKEERLKKSKEYRKNNREKYKQYNREYQKNRCEEDSLYKLSKNLRSRIYAILKNAKNKRTEKLLGAPFEIVEKHLEGTFMDGMSWENYGEWHVDHIIPLASANTVKEIEELCHYKNLQALWAEDNFSKGSKII